MRLDAKKRFVVMKFMRLTDCGPERIVTIKESPSILVELVREHQIPLIPIKARPRHGIRWSIGVDQAWETRDERDLTCRVDATEVVCAIRAEGVAGVVRDDGVAGEKGEDTEHENKETADID